MGEIRSARHPLTEEKREEVPRPPAPSPGGTSGDDLGMEGTGSAGKGCLRAGRGISSPTQPPWETHGVDVLWGEKRWLLPEAGQDEGREHQDEVDVEGSEAEGVQDLALGGQRGGASECQAPLREGAGQEGPLLSGDLPCLRHCAQHLTRITLSSLPCLPYKVGSLTPTFQLRKGSSKRLKNLPKITQRVSGLFQACADECTCRPPLEMEKWGDARFPTTHHHPRQIKRKARNGGRWEERGEQDPRTSR